MAVDNHEAIVDERRKKVAELYLRGHSQRAIGEVVGVTQQCVSLDLKVIREEWKSRAVEDFKTYVADELAKIDNVEQEFWRAWERSVGEHKRTTRTRTGDKKEKSTTTEDLAGDPRFLMGVHRCIERRCQLLGLDAPRRTDITTGGSAFKFIPKEMLDSL
jgi:hypothetical protein